MIEDSVILALDYYSNKKIDFVDLILLPFAKTHQGKIFSFDKKLRKEIDKLEKHEEGVT